MAKKAVKIRHASIYYNGRRMAYFAGSEYSIDSGNEAQIADEGWIGSSSGAKTTQLTADAIIPVSAEGNISKIIRDLLNNEYVKIACALIDGEIHEVDMTVMQAQIRSQAANGTLMGNFSFQGGPPEIV